MGLQLASSRIRKAGVLISGINLILVLFVMAAPFWRVSNTQSSANIFTSFWSYEGLWMECAMVYQGTVQCYQIGTNTQYQSNNGIYNTRYYTYGIYSYLSIYRVFMIIATCLSAIALVLSILGLTNVKVFQEHSNAKRWINIVSGFCHIGTALTVGICVSWYAAEVVREYYSPYYQNTRIKYVLGACLYLGWISIVLSLIAGSILTCCTCFSKPIDSTDYKSTHTSPPSNYNLNNRTEPPEFYKPVSEVFDHRHEDDEERYSRYAGTHKSNGRSHRSNRQDDYSTTWSDDEPDYYRDHKLEVYHEEGFV